VSCTILPTSRAPRQVLREQLECQLPVEVIYNGPMEMTPEILARFEARRATPLRKLRQAAAACLKSGRGQSLSG
jgi:hypothetical protein